MTDIHYRTCPLCEAMCGLEVHVDDGAVTLIRADRDDVWSKGYLCPKGTTLGDLHDDPDRVREPMLREGDHWRVVSWDDAFARCEELLHGVRERHGADAMTAYIGNPTAHNFSLGRYVGLFLGLAAFPMIYSAGTVDQWPKNVSCALMYGNMWSIPAPDVLRTDYLVVMGANTHASQGSLLACPDLLGEIDRIRARGGKTVVIDPRRTGTADRADEWVSIVPGTDAAFLLGVVHALFDDELVELGDVRQLVTGVDAVRAIAGEFPPEVVAPTCGIDAGTIRRLAREIAGAPSAAVYGRIGLCNQEFGTLASWLVDVVNILTGNFDRPGGMMFGNPSAWSRRSTTATSVCSRRRRASMPRRRFAPTRGPGTSGEGLSGCSTSRSGPVRGATGTERVRMGSASRRSRRRRTASTAGPWCPAAPRSCAHRRARSSSAPRYILDDAPRLRDRLGRPRDGLVLTSRRHVRSNSSWMHNVKVLVKGKDRCTLLIHPDDASRVGVVDGGIARVSSEAGSVEVPVEVSDEMMAGVVSLPHGWGHDKADARLSVAREHAGVNNNLLAPGTFVDVISGNAAVNGIPVEVVPI